MAQRFLKNGSGRLGNKEETTSTTPSANRYWQSIHLYKIDNYLIQPIKYDHLSLVTSLIITGLVQVMSELSKLLKP